MSSRGAATSSRVAADPRGRLDDVGHDVPRQDVLAVDADLLGEPAREVAGLRTEAPDRRQVLLHVEA